MPKEPCIYLVIGVGAMAATGWVATLRWRRRAQRYLTAFDRVFQVAQRVYNFNDDEKQELERVLRQHTERDVQS